MYNQQLANIIGFQNRIADKNTTVKCKLLKTKYNFKEF